MFAPAADPEQTAAAREDRERLVQALAALPADERSPLAASALEGRTYAALAPELGLSPGAVKSRAFRARRRLAAELETT